MAMDSSWRHSHYDGQMWQDSETEISYLRSSLHQVCTEADYLISEKDAAMMNLRSQCDRADAGIDKLNKILMQKTTENKILTAQVERANAKIKQLEAEVVDIQVEEAICQKVIKGYRSEIRDLCNQVNNLEDNLCSSKKQIEQLESQNSKLQVQLEEAKCHIQQLSDKLQDSEESQDRLLDLLATIQLEMGKERPTPSQCLSGSKHNLQPKAKIPECQLPGEEGNCEPDEKQGSLGNQDSVAFLPDIGGHSPKAEPPKGSGLV